PADDEIEGPIGQPEIEDAAMLEAGTVAKGRAAGAGAFQMRVDHIHAEQPGAIEHLRQPHRNLPGAAAGVEDGDAGREGVARKKGLFLRPDGLRLRRQRADHRFVRHLPGLRVQRVRHSGIVSRRRFDMHRRTPCLALILAFFLVPILSAQSSNTGPYKVLKRARVGGEGNWDYIYADVAGRRLYIPRRAPNAPPG